VTYNRRAHDRLPPTRNKRDLELAALRLMVLTGILVIVAILLWRHIAWL
jgi:hypothetical protein